MTKVTFEQAKALKELGYPQRVVTSIGWYTPNGQLQDSSIDATMDLLEGECVAHPLELVAKWLRDEKGLMITIEPHIVGKYRCQVFNITDGIGSAYPTGDSVYKDVYDSALSAGIDIAIKILKNGYIL